MPPSREERGGLPSPEEIERLITPRTRAILLVTPSNPTGVVTPPETIDRLQHLAKRHRIALVLDETYADFIPGGQRAHDLFSRPDWGDHFIQIMSFGKTYALTGYRAGMLAASERVHPPGTEGAGHHGGLPAPCHTAGDQVRRGASG